MTFTQIYPRVCLAIGVISTLFPALASPMNVPYNSEVGLVGKFVEKTGTDCCTDGKETRSKFPALLLNNPVNVSAKDPVHPDIDEPPEQDVLLVQLVLNNQDQWSNFYKNKGKQVRVMCILFHSSTGHHKTPVLCDVNYITKPDQY